MNALRWMLAVGLGLFGVVVTASALPRFRRPVLARRLTPYLGALGPRRSDLLGPASTLTGVAAVFDPIRNAVAQRLHRALDDGLELPARLEAAGEHLDVSGFRAEQVSWALTGLVGGIAIALFGVSVGQRSVAGDRGRPRGRRCGRRCPGSRSDVESGGRPTPRGSQGRIADRRRSHVSCGDGRREPSRGPGHARDRRRRSAVRRSAPGTPRPRGGAPLTEALADRARIVGDASFQRFVDAVAAAQERGIPLADSLRSLAFDLREQDKRDLIELAGRKQVSMLVPVITLILPVAILFAFYPGVVAIRTLAR